MVFDIDTTKLSELLIAYRNYYKVHGRDCCDYRRGGATNHSPSCLLLKLDKALCVAIKERPYE